MFAWNNLSRNIVLLAFVALFFIPLPAESLWWREAINSSHTLLFFILSFVIYHSIVRRYRSPNKIIIGIVVLFGGLLLGTVIEILQGLTQRESSLSDVYRDFYGISAALCLVGFINVKGFHDKKLTAVIYMFVGIAFLLSGLMPLIKLSWHYIERDSAFPVIVDFNADWSSSFVRFNNAEMIKVSAEDRNKPDGFYPVQFGRGKYPGISVIEPEPDWSDYHELHVKIFSNDERNIDLILRVHDRQHNQDHDDRFNKKLLIRPGQNEFEIALSQIQRGPAHRQLDLKNIAGLILFASRPQQPVQIEIGNIYLE